MYRGGASFSRTEILPRCVHDDNGQMRMGYSHEVTSRLEEDEIDVAPVVPPRVSVESYK